MRISRGAAACRLVSASRRVLYGAGLVCLVLSASTKSFATPAPGVRYTGTLSTLINGGVTAPQGVAADLSGNVYVADTDGNRLIKVAADGTTSVFSITVGSTPVTLNAPKQLTMDSAGNLYVADTGNNRIVKTDASGNGSILSIGSSLSPATLNAPQGVAVDHSGDVFVSDTGNNRIVEIPSSGSAAVVSTSSLSSPEGIAVDIFGNLYVVDTGHNRVIEKPTSGSESTLSTSGSLSSPVAVGVGMNGNVYIVDGTNRIAVVASQGDAYDLFFDEVNSDFGVPSAIAVTPLGTVYVTDSNTNKLNAFQVDTAGFPAVTLGSSGTPQTLRFMVANSATLTGVSIYTSGTQNLDFTIAANSGTPCTTGSNAMDCTVNVQFTPTTAGLRRGSLVLSFTDTLLGSSSIAVPLFGYGNAPVAALSPGVASVVNVGTVSINQPFQTARDGVGNIYVTSYQNSTVTKVPAGGGTGTNVTIPSLPTPSTLHSPTGLAIDGSGNLFIADYSNSRIVEVTPAGTSKVIAIRGLSSHLSYPTMLSFTPDGRLLVDDYGNGRVVLLSPDIYDNGNFDGDGTVGYATGYVLPLGAYTLGSDNSTAVASDAMGNVYLTDQNTNPGRIIKIDPYGQVGTVPLPSISLNAPLGVTVDPSQNLYVIDSGNNRIIQQTTSGATSVLKYSGPSLGSFVFGVDVDGGGNVLISDFSNNRLILDNVSQSSFTFPSTKEHLNSATQTSTVTNLGDQALVFSANPTYTVNFSQDTSDVNPCTSATSLSSGASCDVPIVFSPQSVGSLSANVTTTNDTMNVGGSTQQISVSGTSTNPGDATSTTQTSPSAGIYNYGQPITISVHVTDLTNTSSVPNGSVTFSDSLTSSIIQRTLDGTGTAVLLNNSALSGIGTHSILASYGGVAGSYMSSSANITVSIQKNTVAVSGPNQVSVSKGQSGSTTLTVTPNGTLAAGAALPSGAITYSILSGSTTVSGPTTANLAAGTGSSTTSIVIPNTLATGSYTISATYAGDGNYQSSSAITIPLTIAQNAPTVALSSNASSVLFGEQVVFTATVSSSAGTPTGSISFYDGSALLGTEPLTSGVAHHTTASLAVGSHTITAAYSGDSNFSAATSSAVSELIQDFTLSTPTSGTNNTPSATVIPGGTATYSLSIGPSVGTVFPAPVTLSLSGLPPGATGTLSPTTLPAGSSLSAVTLTIQLPQTAKADPKPNPMRTAPLALGLLLLPFARKWRRAGKKLSVAPTMLLVLAGTLAAFVGLTGCGARNGFFQQAPQTYTVNIIATSGNLSHSTSVTLTVE